MASFDLSDLDFFKSFTTAQLSEVGSLAEEVTAEPGAVLMEQGRVGQDAFVVVSGEAAVIVAGERVATVGSGSLVGEMALLDVRPRSATVRAISEMELLRFDSAKFRALLKTMPGSEVAKLAEHSQQTRKHNLGED